MEAVVTPTWSSTTVAWPAVTSEPWCGARISVPSLSIQGHTNRHPPSTTDLMALAETPMLCQTLAASSLTGGRQSHRSSLRVVCVSITCLRYPRSVEAQMAQTISTGWRPKISWQCARLPETSESWRNGSPQPKSTTSIRARPSAQMLLVALWASVSPRLEAKCVARATN